VRRLATPTTPKLAVFRAPTDFWTFLASIIWRQISGEWAHGRLPGPLTAISRRLALIPDWLAPRRRTLGACVCACVAPTCSL